MTMYADHACIDTPYGFMYSFPVGLLVPIVFERTGLLVKPKPVPLEGWLEHCRGKWEGSSRDQRKWEGLMDNSLIPSG